jgi:hypothetical protein
VAANGSYIVEIDDYVMLFVRHTDGTTLHVHKTTYSHITLLTKAFNAGVVSYLDEAQKAVSSILSDNSSEQTAMAELSRGISSQTI